MHNKSQARDRTLDKIVKYYADYDEENRLTRHPIEHITTTYMLDKFLRPGNRILDVAAGTGIYSLYFALKGCVVTAEDITPKHIEILNEKIAKQGLQNISAAIGDARDLLFSASLPLPTLPSGLTITRIHR